MNDKNIRKMFDRSYQSEPQPADYESIDETGKYFINQVTQTGVTSVLDVGMGAGGLLLLLQERNVTQLAGIELSPTGVELARKRFEQFGDTSEVTLLEGSFIDMDPIDTELIMFRNVIHCHPDFAAMIGKAISLNPKFILYNIPKNTFRNKLLFNMVSIFTRIFNGFKAYIHPQVEINKILESNSYTKISYNRMGIWEVYMYQKS